MDRFLIAPLNSGQQSDTKPWLLPDQAFESIDNAYVYRGRIRKRFGSRVMNTGVSPTIAQLHTRLRVPIVTVAPIALGATDGGGNAGGNVGYAYYFLGQTFTVGAQTYTINSLLPGVQPMLATMGTGTFNITTGAFTITAGPPATPIFFNPFNSSTNALGNAAGVVPGIKFALGQMFSVGNAMYTIIDGTPGVHNMLATVGAGTFNRATGAFTITGSTVSSVIYFYPADPVMGLLTYEIGTANDNPIIGFDTQFAYQFLGGAWTRAGTFTWTGNDTQFFWGTSWQDDFSYTSNLFVVNFNAADHIQWWDGAAWNVLNPVVDSVTGATLDSCRILILFKGTLIALNTIETGGLNFVNRARWHQVGSPVDVNAWDCRIPGRGGFSDAPTKQAIVTAQVLRDRLIVYFDSSTWEFVYTNNECLPFRWQQINTELGAESTFSQVPFDKVVLGIGNVGIHACNGAQVERIDEKIPQEVFEIHASNDGVQRVYGIRDYFTEMVYWSYTSVNKRVNDQYKYPNRVMVFNYRLGTWSFNDDSITAFGYYETQDPRTWQNMQQTWAETTDEWGSGQLAANPRQIIAGNQEGFTFLVDANNPKNAPVLSIITMTPVTNVLTIINHNLLQGDFVSVENCQGITNFNDLIFKVLVINENTIQLQVAPPLEMVGVYTGGGTLRRVSKIDILTKQYNFYIKDARNAFISKVDFLVDKEDGQLFIECYPSYSNQALVADAILYNDNLGTSILELSPYRDSAGNLSDPIENAQKQYWHPVYFQAEGEAVQFRFSLNDQQMATPVIAFSDFYLNAFAIYAMPTGSRLQG